MSNVIRFLERIGSEAQWGDITKVAMELALTDAKIEGPLCAAILNRDAAQLQVLLQQKPLVGYVSPGEEEEEEEEQEEEGEDKPGDKDALRSSLHSTSFQL